MFWLAGKGIVSPQTLQTRINAELEKSRLYSSIYTMDYCEQKKPFKESNSPQAHTLALNPPTIHKKTCFVCKSCLCEQKRKKDWKQ